MTISKTVNLAINKQINAEIYSSYLYLALAAYFDGSNLPGFSNWMKKQAKEELEHAMKFYGYVFERGGSVELFAVDKPVARVSSPKDAFALSYKHEQLVTKLINDIDALAEKEHDRATCRFLDWFIDEQVEEEDNARSILETLEKIGDSANGILMLDRELGKRE